MADSVSSALAALTTALVYGCPYASYLSLASACSVFDVPACVAPLTNINYDAACCGSLTAYGSSVIDCFTKLNPACLDTSAVLASLSTHTPGDPCAAYATPGAGNPQTTIDASTAATTTAAEASGTTAAPASGSTATGAGATATGTGASASAGTTKASAAGKVAGASLKVYLGLAVVGFLAVLNF